MTDSEITDALQTVNAVTEALAGPQKVWVIAYASMEAFKLHTCCTAYSTKELAVAAFYDDRLGNWDGILDSDEAEQAAARADADTLAREGSFTDETCLWELRHIVIQS